jgi:hypothetical protein
MKKLIVLLVLAGVLALPTAALADPPDQANAAVVIKIYADICVWDATVGHPGTGPYTAVGSVHYVETSSGHWKLTCEGALLEGSTFPDSAVVVKSTSEEPQGYCRTPFGSATANWHSNVTPSGESKITCQGEAAD